VNEREYFGQFSSYNSNDDSWWDTWAIVYDGFIHREFRSEDEANQELTRLSMECPEYQCRIVKTENAGYGDMRFKALSYPFYPIGGFEAL